MTAPPNGHTIYFHPRCIIYVRDEENKTPENICLFYYFIKYAILNLIFNEKMGHSENKGISLKFFL